MSSSSSLPELLEKIAQLNLERKERKCQLKQLEVEISKLQTEVQARGGDLLDSCKCIKVYYTVKQLFFDMLESKIKKLDKYSAGGENQEDGGLLEDFIIEMKNILASEVRRTTPHFNDIRDNMDPKFYHADIENLVVDILDLFDKWIA